ncbi:hypothetical protein D9M69_625720 [compost metagenome]
MQAERISFFIKCDSMLFAGFTIANNNARQAIIPLHPDQMMFESAMRKDKTPWNFSDDFLPVFRLRCRCWSAHDLKVFGAIDIGQNEKFIATGREVVFNTSLALHDELRLCSRIICRQQPAFRGFVVVNIYENIIVE